MQRLRNFAHSDLLAFEPVARIAESGLAAVKEIETYWSFEDVRKGIAYLEMKGTIDRAIQILLTPKK